jgi:AraC-like DNA-binding protein
MRFCKLWFDIFPLKLYSYISWMITDTFISVFDLVIFLGVVQGIFISLFFIRSGRGDVKPNLYQGLLLLFLSFSMLEELLNNTGYIVKVMPISNFAEPFNFTFGPLAFLYIRTLLYPDSKKKVWPHFLIFSFWMLYIVLYFIQPVELKYNAYLGSKHPDWPRLDTVIKINNDPLGIRPYTNLLTGIHFSIYIAAMFYLVIRKMKQLNERLFKLSDPRLKIARNVGIHFMVIALIFTFVKLYFGADIGDYLISSYLSFMIFSTSWMVVRNSSFFGQPQFFLQFPGVKYEKSSLSEKEKASIHQKILKEMEVNRYYAGNLASLSDLAHTIRESSHHVSQVINEVMGRGFFEMLAWYRVEEAKRIIRADREAKLTVEDIAEQVGYNSKSSFNTVFKKQTGQTPSEFRRSGNNS